MHLAKISEKTRFYQWDTGHRLIVEGDEQCDTVSFSKSGSQESYVCQVKNDGKRYVDIPNILFQEPGGIWVNLQYTDDSGLVLPHSQHFVVLDRVKPADYVYTESEVQNYDALDARIEVLENSDIDADRIAASIEKYMESNPVTPESIGALPADKLSEAVNDALTQAKASGEFKGDPGEKGERGLQGEPGPKGETGDSGAAGADGKDGKTPVKGTDYFTEADKTEMVEDVLEAMDGIPAYWQTALDEGTEAINKALCEAGRNKSAFLFYSDAHWDYGAQMAPTLLKYLHNHTGMAKTFFGGDIVNDEPDDANVEEFDEMSYLWDWRRQLKGLPNHHSVPGNHDNANGKGGLFTEQFIYGYLLAAEETPDIVRGDAGLYYYIDNPAERTRYLCLDTACKDAYSLSDEQKTFINDSLKSTPAGWHIVVVAHSWYVLDYDQYDKRPVPLKGISATASEVVAILDNYNSRNGEFADCGAWVEFCIGGHIHYDYDATTATGIPIILVETDSMHTRGTYTYTAGTTTESSVNGIIADYDNHKIHVVRIGRGASREIAVTNYVVSYTNVLPLAKAVDGVNIYGEDYNGDCVADGYKSGVRWSSSGNSDSAQDGIFMTGYIPASSGDIIRLKNITMNKANASNRGCHLHLFKSLTDTNESTLDANGGLNEGNVGAVFDDSGNLVQFTIIGEYTYFRLQGTYIGPDSIITINEPIAD